MYANADAIKSKLEGVFVNSSQGVIIENHALFTV